MTDGGFAGGIMGGKGPAIPGGGIAGGQGGGFAGGAPDGQDGGFAGGMTDGGFAGGIMGGKGPAIPGGGDGDGLPVFPSIPDAGGNPGDIGGAVLPPGFPIPPGGV